MPPSPLLSLAYCELNTAFKHRQQANNKLGLLFCCELAFKAAPFRKSTPFLVAGGAVNALLDVDLDSGGSSLSRSVRMGFRFRIPPWDVLCRPGTSLGDLTRCWMPGPSEARVCALCTSAAWDSRIRSETRGQSLTKAYAKSPY